jgi:hypothetical protein
LLATRYEQLRDQAVHGHPMSSLGAAVLRRQGLPAWMTLVAAEEAARVASGDAPSSSHPPSHPPATVRRELLAAFTDLLIGAFSA